MCYKTEMASHVFPVFSTSPDPTCMYQTPGLKAAVAKIRMAINGKQGLSCIFGDVGLGKSSLLRYLMSGLMADGANLSFLPSGDLPSSFGFLKRVSSDLQIPPQRSRLAQMDSLEEFLTAQHEDGKTTVLLIDEAQLLDSSCLESIRSLLNYETNTEKMIQIVLSGQLDLRDRMAHKRNKAFRSRIVAPVLMEPLTADETVAMVDYRLKYWEQPNRFTEEALERLHALTGGVPRTVLLTCQYAYAIASTEHAAQVGPELIDRGFNELSLVEKQPKAVGV